MYNKRRIYLFIYSQQNHQVDIVDIATCLLSRLHVQKQAVRLKIRSDKWLQYIWYFWYLKCLRNHAGTINQLPLSSLSNQIRYGKKSVYDYVCMIILDFYLIYESVNNNWTKYDWVGFAYKGNWWIYFSPDLASDGLKTSTNSDNAWTMTNDSN